MIYDEIIEMNNKIYKRLYAEIENVCESFIIMHHKSIDSNYFDHVKNFL